MKTPNLIKIIQSGTGETLVETLAAILVVTLATTMLLGAIQTATNISSKSQELQAQLDLSNKTPILDQSYDTRNGSGDHLPAQKITDGISIVDDISGNKQSYNQSYDLDIYSVPLTTSDEDTLIFKFLVGEE